MKHQLILADVADRITITKNKIAQCDQCISQSVQEITDTADARAKAKLRLAELTETLKTLEADNA